MAKVEKLKPRPCRKCGSRKIKISDCGYSSFNVGSVMCESCGHTIKVSPCSCSPEQELIAVWNADKANTHEACILAYPIVAAYCNAMGESCPKDAADALGALHDALGLGPESLGGRMAS